ncbi:MAG: ribosomal-processing cysteine protease Prp [Lactobacillales bacterium]|jgi:uncharacterized protein YsxB (DUF464 family)|nr:ribosomal-processing cysteine protease Prp [Lactobacillales bacterium]
MIKAIFSFGEQNKIQAFTISGHADFDSEGRDIVCSAVSVLAQNAINSVEALAHIKVDAEIRDGYLSATFPSGNIKIETILDSLYIGIDDIADQFPTYVEIDRR